jgi:hypothetical protein
MVSRPHRLPLGELYGAFVSATRESAGRALIHICAAAFDPVLFPGTAGLSVGVLL